MQEDGVLDQVVGGLRHPVRLARVAAVRGAEKILPSQEKTGHGSW